MKPLPHGPADVQPDPVLPKKIMSHSAPTPRANLYAALSTLESSPQRMWQDLLPNEQWQDLTVQLAKPGATAMLYGSSRPDCQRRKMGGGGGQFSECTSHSGFTFPFLVYAS